MASATGFSSFGRCQGDETRHDEVMKMRFLSALWIGLLLCVSDTLGEDKPKVSDRVFKVPFVTLKNPRGDGSVKPVQLAPTSDGEARYDVSSWLESCGVESKPAFTAIALEKSGLVVMRGSKEALELADRVLEIPGIQFSTTVLELGVRLWEYEDDPAVEADKKPRTIAQLRERGGSSLRLLDVVSVVTKSGNRVIGENKQFDPSAKVSAPEPNAATVGKDVPGPFRDGSRGSVLEMEPNIGPDGASIDFQMAYHCRFPQAGGPDLVMQIATNGTVHDMSELAYYSAIALPAAKEKLARFRVVTVRARRFDCKGMLFDELGDDRRKRDADAVKRAFEGLNLDK